MKNITVSVPDDVYRGARVRAAEEGKSLSALVAAYLDQLSGQALEFSRLEARENELRRRIRRFRATDRASRDELHDRSLR